MASFSSPSRHSPLAAPAPGQRLGRICPAVLTAPGGCFPVGFPLRGSDPPPKTNMSHHVHQKCTPPKTNMYENDAQMIFLFQGSRILREPIRSSFRGAIWNRGWGVFGSRDHNFIEHTLKMKEPLLSLESWDHLKKLLAERVIKNRSFKNGDKKIDVVLLFYF